MQSLCLWSSENALIPPTPPHLTLSAGHWCGASAGGAVQADGAPVPARGVFATRVVEGVRDGLGVEAAQADGASVTVGGALWGCLRCLPLVGLLGE